MPVLTKISNDTQALAAKLKGIKLDDFDAEAAHFTKLLEIAAASSGKKVAELEQKIADWVKTPTRRAWTDLGLKNGFRSLANTLGNDPRYADLWVTWKPWDGL